MRARFFRAKMDSAASSASERGFGRRGVGDCGGGVVAPRGGRDARAKSSVASCAIASTSTFDRLRRGEAVARDAHLVTYESIVRRYGCLEQVGDTGSRSDAEDSDRGRDQEATLSRCCGPMSSPSRLRIRFASAWPCPRGDM